MPEASAADARRASTRLALPSIDALAACLCLRRAAYHNRPAPAAVATTIAGLRRIDPDAQSKLVDFLVAHRDVMSYVA